MLKVNDLSSVPPPQQRPKQNKMNLTVGINPPPSVGNIVALALPQTSTTTETTKKTLIVNTNLSNQPSDATIKEGLKEVELDQNNHKIRIFENAPNQTHAQFLSETFQKNPTFHDIEEGVTDTKVVKTDEQARLILKRVSLPNSGIMWTILKEKITESNQPLMKDKLQEVLITNIMDELNHKAPYTLAAHREKLAYIIGHELGVPEVKLIKDSSGVYSVHQFVPSNGSLRKKEFTQGALQNFDTQSLQNIAILDILLGNEDRNAGNILWYEENGVIKLVPIDHALTLQQSSSELNTRMGYALEGGGPLAGIPPPYWYLLLKGTEKLSEPLTAETKQHVREITSQLEQRINEAETTLILDDDTKKTLRENASRLQQIVNSNENLTLEGLMKAFYG
ncbi:MAG: hypothetical protein KDK76_07755 [Chlamydiia bacterium]|nr:hypothetical protein [Chlamydiia bacterium]